MSYPSVAKILEEQKIDLETASDEVLADTIWEALRRDLADGLSHLTDLAHSLAGATEKRLLYVGDPNSPLGKQLIRLLGSDISRSICERKLNVTFGFYNCCNVVAARSRAELDLSFREQIELQNGALASADC